MTCFLNKLHTIRCLLILIVFSGCMSHSYKDYTKTYDPLKKSSVIESYPVNITLESIAGLKRSPTEFDFADIELLTDLSPQHCYYEIQRQEIATNRVERMALGQLEIRQGRIAFITAWWHTGGLASPDYLINEGNLIIDVGGNLIGRIPYFHVFIDEGEVARRPLYVTLGEHEKKRGKNGDPIGVYLFTVDDWQIGRIEILKCKDV